MKSLGDHPFRLGEWTVRPRQNRIERNGERTSLEPKLLDVLLHLASAPGETHLRQEILDTVWKDTFVTDEVLTNAVFELRRALGDQARDPSYIETIPRKGYRLVAPVAPIEGSPARTPEVPAPSGRWGIRLTLAGLAAGGLIAVALLTLRSDAPSALSPTPWPESIAVLPIEALSADPRHRAFAKALTDTLTTELAAEGRFEVPSRSTVEELVGRGVPATELSRQLKVDAFLEGTLSFSDAGRARLSSQLIDRRVDRHLWARIFEADVRQNLEAERRLSRLVALQLAAKSPRGPKEAADAASSAVSRPEAPDGAGWRFRTGGEIWASPVRSGDQVLVASDDGNLYALDAAEGLETWRYRSPQPIRDPATPEDEATFLSICDYVVALDPTTGDERWRRRLSAISPVTSTPRALLVGSFDGDLHGLSPEDGTILWRIATHGDARTSAALVDGRAVVGTDAGEVIVVDPGPGRADLRLDLGSAIGGLTGDGENNLLIATDDGFLYRLTPHGEELWRRSMNSRLSVAPLVGNGVVYQGTGDGRVVALDLETAEVLWSAKLRDAVGATPSLEETPEGGRLYVGSLDHHLYALDALDGRELWRYAAASWVVTRPLLVDDLVVFGDLSGVVYGLPRERTESTPDSSWPEAGSPRTVASDPENAPSLAWRTEAPDASRLTADERALWVSHDTGVRAIGHDGALRWEVPVVGGILAAALVLPEQVVVASGPGTLLALHPDDGRELWRTELGARTVARPITDGKTIYVGDREGRLHAVERDGGNLVWTAPATPFINGAAVVSGELVLVGSCGEEVWAFDRASGDLRWSTHAGECVVSDGLVLGDLAFFGSSRGELLALDVATGSRRWTFAANGEDIWYRPLPLGDQILFGSGDYHLYSLDRATGLERWRFRAENRILSELAGYEGHQGIPLVIFGSHDRRLYAIDAESGHEAFRIETTRDVQNLLVQGDRLYFLGDHEFLYAYDLP